MQPTPPSQDELAQIGGSWGDLKRVAVAVDDALSGNFSSTSSSSGKFTTLCHGAIQPLSPLVPALTRSWLHGAHTHTLTGLIYQP